MISSGLWNNSRRRPTLPQSFPCSTIGPGGLNFRVRDGIGCNPSGKTAGNLLSATAPKGGMAPVSQCQVHQGGATKTLCLERQQSSFRLDLINGASTIKRK